jgi:hypothetical protein
MNTPQINPVMAKRIRLSGSLLIFGMAVEAFSFIWKNPTAFLVFIAVGGTAMALGVLTFLYSLVSVRGGPASE